MAPSTSPKTVTPAKRKFCEVSTVTLLVGKSKKPFHVHVNLLCDASPFFKAALAGKSKESSEKHMQLPEDDESTFELFVDWLYCQRYEMLPDDGDHEDDGGDNTDERFLQPFRLFVFADKYNVCKLKNLVIETLFVDGRGPLRGPGHRAIAYAYNHTTQGSGLRKLLADWYAWNIDLGWYEFQDIDAFLRQQPDFAPDVVLSFAKNLKWRHKQIHNPFAGDMPEEYKDKEGPGLQE